MAFFWQVFFSDRKVSRHRRPSSLRVPPLILRRVTGSRTSCSELLVLSGASGACVNEPWPTLLTNVGSPWLYWRLTPDAARPSQPARPLGAVQKAARRPCRG